VRKAIARVYIVMHQKQKENLRKLFKVSVQQVFLFFFFFDISSVEHKMYKLTPWSKCPVKLMVTLLVKKFSYFHGFESFIGMFITRALHY
jgi:hypothetical protein